MSQEHKCFESMDKVLLPLNCQLDLSLWFDCKNNALRLALPIAVKKKDDAPRRTKVPVLACAFCPICGVKLFNGSYPTEETSEVDAGPALEQRGSDGEKGESDAIRCAEDAHAVIS
jgi:hypothetical protein